MKKILSILMTLVLLSSLFATFSISTNASTAYVESFSIGKDPYMNTAKEFLSGNHFNIIDADINKNCSFSDYIYLGYKTTANEADAIHDIIALDGSEYGNVSSWTNPENNCVYYPVSGLDRGVWKSAIDINATTGGDYIYLFVTKDANAGAPISDPIVTYDRYYTGRNTFLRIYGKEKHETIHLKSASAWSSSYIYYNSNGYVSDLHLGVGKLEDTAQLNAEKDYYKLVSTIDLNDEAGGRFIFLSEKITSNASDAIRDIVILNGSQYGEMTSWYNEANGCTYYPVGAYSGSGTPDWWRAMDLNYKAGGDWLYMYVTKDARAGEPITAITVAYGDIAGWTTVKYANTDTNADVNKGAGGDDIFICYSRTAVNSTGSIFTEKTVNTAIIAVSSAVIILGIAVGIYFTRKRKTAVTA